MKITTPDKTKNNSPDFNNTEKDPDINKDEELEVTLNNLSESQISKLITVVDIDEN